MFNQSTGVKDGFAVFSSLYGTFGESFVFQELIDERHFIGHGRLSQLKCLLNTLLCSKEESLRKVACVGAQVCLGELWVQVKGLLAVKESFLVLALLYVRHRSVREHAFILA